eukprot:GHVH01009384.1.p1 GENE.GHVH01009384.1~~GHVH01009384.1.p1  ORF type:complete len:382 (+),score=61.50 GHVH01009384.1:187-1332(+)
MASNANNATVLLSVELIKSLNQYEEVIKRLTANYNTHEREARLRACNDLDSKIKDIRQVYIREIKEIPSGGDERILFVQDLKEQMDRYKRLKIQFDERKNALDRDGMDTQIDTNAMDQPLNNEQQMAAAINLGDKLQDKTEDAIHNMMGLATEAEDVAVATDQKLADQNEQLERIAAGYDNITAATKIAKKETKKMATALCRDKFIMGLFFIDLLFVVAIICIYAFWRVDDEIITTTTTTTTTTEAMVFFEQGYAYAEDFEDFTYDEHSRLRGFKHLKPNDTSYQAMAFVNSEPRYDDKERIGMVEGMKRYIKCSGDNNSFTILNTRLSWSVRGMPFGVVDFSNFKLEDNKVTCSHRKMRIDNCYGGYRSMVRSPFLVDWN